MSIYKKHYKDMIDKYKNGMSTHMIADEYGCDVHTVRNVINKAGIMRTRSETRAFRDSKYSKYYTKWIEEYESGSSINDIANIYSCSAMTVYLVVKKAGKIRTPLDIYNEKYGEVDKYFDKIDTEGVAYYLGILLADGCIKTRDGGRQQVLSFGLQNSDRYIVEELANIFGRKIYQHLDEHGNCKLVSVYINSDHIVNTLRKYGFIERKSLDDHDAIGFDHVPDELMHHFIRGIIDGDGCIYLTRYYGGSIKVVGNKNDMQGIVDVFVGIGCRNVIPKRQGNIYVVCWYSKSDIRNIINYIYSDATIYMTRKKHKADQILDRYNRHNT